MINDINLKINIQSKAVDVLKKYIEILNEASDYSEILMQIIRTLTMKFQHLAKYIQVFCENPKKMDEKAIKRKTTKNHLFNKLLNLEKMDDKRTPVKDKSPPAKELNIDKNYENLKRQKNREQEIENLFKETKHIVTKITDLMTFLSTTLLKQITRHHVDSPNPFSNNASELLSQHFHYGIKYFLITSYDYRSYSHDPIQEEEELRKNVKLFIDIFVQLEIPSFKQIFERQIGFLYKCIINKQIKRETKKPEEKSFDTQFLLAIPQYMKDNLNLPPHSPEAQIKQQKSVAFAHILARFLLEKFENIGGYSGKKSSREENADIQKYSLTLDLFRTVMEIFSSIENIEDLQSYYLNFLVLSVKYSKRAKVFENYFTVIKLILQAVKGKTPDILNNFDQLLSGLVTIIQKVNQECSVLNELIAEICQYLPLNPLIFSEYCPFLSKIVLNCLSPINSNVTNYAIKFFENWIVNLPHLPGVLDPLLMSIFSKFIKVLYNLFSCEQYKSSINNILSRLGGKSRIYMIEKEASIKPFPDQRLRFCLRERCTKKEIFFGIELSLNASFEYLKRSSNIKPKEINSIYHFVKGTFYSFIDHSLNADYIRTGYSALIRHDYKELQKLAENYFARNFEFHHPQMRISVIDRENEKCAFEKLLKVIIFLTAENFTQKECGEKIDKFFLFVCEHLVLIGLCRNGMLRRGNVNEIDPLTYFDVIIKCLNDAVYSNQSQITRVSLKAIKHIAQSYMEIFNFDPYAINRIQLLDLLIKKINSQFYRREYAKKEGSSLALKELMEILSIEFFQKYELEIVKALIYALNTLPEFITVTAHTSCQNTLKQLLLLCHPNSHFQYISTKKIEATDYLKNKMIEASELMKIDSAQLQKDFFLQFRNICVCLIQQLNSNSKFARKICKECIEQLRKCEGLTLEEILQIDSAIFSSEEEVPDTAQTTAIDIMKEALFKKPWSKRFAEFEYSLISAGVDCLDFLITKDEKGNIIERMKDIGSKLLNLNEELLKIIESEISSQEKLMESSNCSSYKNYYILQEKIHISCDPLYDNTIETIYRSPPKTEKERLEAALSSEEQKKMSDSEEPNNIIDSKKKLEVYASTKLKSIFMPPEQALFKGEYYIYNLFPMGKDRIKAACMCVKMLRNQFIKFSTEAVWAGTLSLDRKEKEHYKEQRSRFIILLFRLLKREEMCIYKSASESIKIIFESIKNTEDELLPKEILRNCFSFVSNSKNPGFIEFRNIKFRIKFLPEHLPLNCSEQMQDAICRRIGKLQETTVKSSDKFNREGYINFNIILLLITLYKYDFPIEEDKYNLAKHLIENVEMIQSLIHKFEMSERIIKNILAKLFNRFKVEVLEYISYSTNCCLENYYILRKISLIIKMKKTEEFCSHLISQSVPIFRKMFKCYTKGKQKDCTPFHEILGITYKLMKRYKNDISNIEFKHKFFPELIKDIILVWKYFTNHPEITLRNSWSLQSDFCQLLKLLLFYIDLFPEDVEVVYFLVNNIRSPECENMRRITHYFCSLFPEKIKVELFVEKYLSVLEEEKLVNYQIINYTKYVMIPMFSFIYQQSKIENIQKKDYELVLLSKLLTKTSWSSIVQKYLFQFANLILENITKEKINTAEQIIKENFFKEEKPVGLGVQAWAFLSIAKLTNTIPVLDEHIQAKIYEFFCINKEKNSDIFGEGIDFLVLLLYIQYKPSFHTNFSSIEKALEEKEVSLNCLQNLMETIVGNSKIICKHKLDITLIPAFKIVFFRTRSLTSKMMALEFAEAMWKLSKEFYGGIKDLKPQISKTIMMCLYKEFIQLHSIFSCKIGSEEERLELTCRGLFIFYNILKEAPTHFLYFPVLNQPKNINNTIIIQSSTLNVINIILKYSDKTKITDELIDYFICLVEKCCYRDWNDKSEPSDIQKDLNVIQGICNFCLLVKNLKKTYPPKWKEIMYRIFQQDLKEFSKRKTLIGKVFLQHSEERNESEVNKVKIFRDQLYLLIPQLSIRLFALHNQISMLNLFLDYFTEFFNSLMDLCTIYSKFIKFCNKCEYSSFNNMAATATSPSWKDLWNLVAQEDSETVIINQANTNIDSYIKETVSMGAYFLASKVTSKKQHTKKDFDYLIDLMAKDYFEKITFKKIAECVERLLKNNPSFKTPSDIENSDFILKKNSKILINILQFDLKRVYPILEEFLVNYPKKESHSKNSLAKLINYTLFRLRKRSNTLRKEVFLLFDKYLGRSIFCRLKHIFIEKNWTILKVGNRRYWLQLSLELLLSSIDVEPAIRSEPEILTVYNSPKLFEKELMEQSSEKLEYFIQKNAKTVSNLKKENYGISSLKEVIPLWGDICEKLWPQLFPQFWNLLSTEKQQHIAFLINSLLNEEKFIKLMQEKFPKTIPTILETIAACNSLPILSPQKIQYIGENCRAWHTAIPHLEKYLCASPPIEGTGVCLEELYRKLKDTDYLFGLQRCVSNNPITHAGLSYMQFSMWQEAYELFPSALRGEIIIQKDQEDIMRSDSSLSKQSDTFRNYTQTDIVIWEKGLIESAQQLNNWNCFTTIDIPDTIVAFKLEYNWDKKNSSCFVKRILKGSQEESVMVFLASLYNLFPLSSEDEREYENNYKSCLRALYSSWNMLPTSICASHYSLIILQQHFFEINECKMLFNKNCKHKKKNLGKDVSKILESWRERLPQMCEPFSVWRDLLECRNFLISKMLNRFSENIKSFETLPFFHDIILNYLKLTEMARKNGLIDETISYLEKVDKSLEGMGESFDYERILCIKEKVKLRNYYKSEWISILELIISVQSKPLYKNNPIKKSEILRYKGEIYFCFGKLEEAYNSFKESTACPQNYKSWVSLASFCEQMMRIYNEERYIPEIIKGLLNASRYMLSKNKFFIPKVFDILQYIKSYTSTDFMENASYKTFYEFFCYIPRWIWLFWLPQIIGNLRRSHIEQEISKIILRDLVILYPQPLFLHLQRILQKPSTESTLIKNIISEFMLKNEIEAEKISTIKFILNELEKKILGSFRKDEELLIDFRKLYVACFPLEKCSSKKLSNLIKHNITEKYFMSSSTNLSEIQKKCKSIFSLEEIQKTKLEDNLRKIQKWIDYLHTELSLRSEHNLINEYSPELANLIPDKIEMFGLNYQNDIEPSPINIIYISLIKIKIKKSLHHTRVEFSGNNGKNYNYYLQHHNEDEQKEILIAQLRNILNLFFSTQKKQLKRG